MSELALYERFPDMDLLELSFREADSIKVELLYKRIGNKVLIHLIDQKEENDVTFPVPSDKAMDAFNHPYSYYGDFLARQAA